MLGSLKHPAYLKAVKFEHEGAGGSLRFTSKTLTSALTTEMSAKSAIAKTSMRFLGLPIVVEVFEELRSANWFTT